MCYTKIECYIHFGIALFFLKKGGKPITSVYVIHMEIKAKLKCIEQRRRKGETLEAVGYPAGNPTALRCCGNTPCSHKGHSHFYF